MMGYTNCVAAPVQFSKPLQIGVFNTPSPTVKLATKNFILVVNLTWLSYTFGVTKN